MQFSSVYSYLFATGLGFGYANNGGTLPARPQTSYQRSVEARLAGNSDKFKWVGGLYYYNESQQERFFATSGALQNSGFETGYGTRSYAAFGQGTFEIVDHVRLIGGLRYTSDQRSISDGKGYYVRPSILAPTNACFVPLIVLGDGQCINNQFAGHKTFTNVSWKAGVEGDATENVLVYATVSRGFKAVGFNTQSSVIDPGSATKVGGALLFAPEILTSYEAGAKGRFLDNRLQVNVEGSSGIM